jgi:repressor LexA
VTLSAVPDQPRPKLTDRERQVLRAIQEHYVARGYAPSVREIGKAVGMYSPSTVAYHLRHLAEKGYLRRPAGKVRAIEVVPE